jgi:tetratricopeptide (TPR) repeat protein
MVEKAMDAQPLKDQRVAFTGRLACLTRARAADLVRAHGGEWLPAVTRLTSMVVVGQEGWPLGRDGRLTQDLQKARKLQRSQHISILTETDFLARLGMASGGPQRLSTAELSQLLKVSGERIRGWVRLGLVRPSETVHGVHYFDFRQVSWAKTLCGFARAGVTADRIRRSLEQLKTWLPEAQQPLEQLAVLERDGQLLVRLDQGKLAEPGGQRLFDFADEMPVASVSMQPGPRTDDDWFRLGLQHEEAGRWLEAAQAYRQALAAGRPDADTCFNLGNVLYTLGRKDQAVERFRQAVEIDQRFTAAWNNLGNVLAELNEHEEAIEAFQKVLQVDPHNPEAHYNLADALEELGRTREARPHWEAYFRIDPTSRWGTYARKRLADADRPRQA